MKNKFKTEIISLAILLLALFTSCDSHKKENSYGLDIISDITTYNKSVKRDSNNLLINLDKFTPEIVLDIRYATPNNFTGEQIYLSPEAYVRKPVAGALVKIQKELNSKGLGLKIFDAYRPYAATVKFYEVYPDTNFVAAPWRGSVHNRGCAVDVTLIDLKTGKELMMPTPFDDFTEKAGHSYTDLPGQILKNRQTLKEIMTKHGFIIYGAEWWHYSYKDWENYELMDVSFKELND